MSQLNLIFIAFTKSLNRIFSKAMRHIFWQILLISIVIFLLLWLLIHYLFSVYVYSNLVPYIGNIESQLSIFAIFTSMAFIFGWGKIFYFIFSPIITFTGSFYSNNIIKIVEEQDYPNLPKGKELTGKTASLLNLKFFLTLLMGNILVVIIYFFTPFYNLFFYLINGYVFGKFYFLINAFRYTAQKQALSIYDKNWPIIWLAGIIVAIISFLPFVGIITAIFAPAFFTYLYHDMMSPQNNQQIVQAS